MELTQEDKLRIEQEAATLLADIGARYEVDLFNDGTTHTHLEVNVRRYMVAMAEYATIYERQQQAELRNKVIEECIEKVRYSYNLSLGATDTVVELLNSLKTK